MGACGKPRFSTGSHSLLEGFSQTLLSGKLNIVSTLFWFPADSTASTMMTIHVIFPAVQIFVEVRKGD